MFIGHLGLSYLISQAPRLRGRKLPWKEVIFLIFAGYVLDLDLFITGLNGINHHYLPIHTPFFALLLGALFFVLLRRHFSKTALWLVFPVLFGHLILDDIGHWFYLLGWQAITNVPQINWLYPFTAAVGDSVLLSFPEIVRLYLTQAPANVVLEIILIISASAVFLKKTLLK